MNVSTVLFIALAAALGAEPTPEALAKVRAELTDSHLEVRCKAMQALIHSELSAHLIREIQAGLKDTEGEIRATAATALGNLGARAEPAIPLLIAQLSKDGFKQAWETAARALGRIGKAKPDNRAAVKPLRRAAAEDTDPVTRTSHGLWPWDRWP